MGAPIVDIQGSVGPAGISRPKHKRTHTGFGAGEIKSLEGESANPLHHGMGHLGLVPSCHLELERGASSRELWATTPQLICNAHPPARLHSPPMSDITSVMDAVLLEAS